MYTLFADRRTVREHFPNADIRTSGLQNIPGITRIYPALGPLMPSAVESFDVSAYDTVLSSSVTFAKGIVVRPGTRHVCYCYSPTRSLWDRAAAYERRGVASRLYRHALRAWDHAAAQRPDQMIAISQTTADRIAKYYRRQAIVVPPPAFLPVSDELIVADPFYLVVGRLVPHKMPFMLLEAFAKLRHRLVIAGDGPLHRRLSRQATRNVELLGNVSDGQLDRLYRSCRAVIVPNEEDWGLTAVEAMGYGKPVLALGRGGVTETVVAGVTGEFFDDPIPEALADGIRRLEARFRLYDSQRIRAHAQQYGEAPFAHRMRILLEHAV
jgi:glycosyltransferase involved in cell wall biosynthesis